MSQALMIGLAVVAGGAVLALMCLAVLWLVIRSARPRYSENAEAKNGEPDVSMAERISEDQAREFGEEIKSLNAFEKRTER